MSTRKLKKHAPLSMGPGWENKLPKESYKTDVPGGYPVAVLGSLTDKDADYTYPGESFLGEFIRNNKFAFAGFPLKAPRLVQVVCTSGTTGEGLSVAAEFAGLLAQLNQGLAVGVALAATDVTTHGVLNESGWMIQADPGGNATAYAGETITFVVFDGAAANGADGYHDKFDTAAVQPTAGFKLDYDRVAASVGPVGTVSRSEGWVTRIPYPTGAFGVSYATAETAALDHYAKAFVPYSPPYSPPAVFINAWASGPNLAKVKAFFGIP